MQSTMIDGRSARPQSRASGKQTPLALLRRVKLLIDTSSSWGRDLIHGVSVYVKQRGNWVLDLEYGGRFEKARLPASWRGDGVIARVTNSRIAREIIRSGRPAVNVSWYSYGAPHIPRCTNNEESCGRLMAEYLLRRGFRSFAYFGPSRQQRPGYCDRVKEAFVHTLAEAGCRCALWPHQNRKSKGSSNGEIAHWLYDHPQPVGVGVWGDHIGRHVAELCRIASLSIPEQVAIISAEYDALMNSLSRPPLTTIDYMADRVGYEAAALLDRMMDGHPAPAEDVLIDAMGVITRQSTEVVAVADVRVAAALSLIRQSVHKPVHVNYLLKELGVTRRSLEQEFRKVLGRSIAEEIRGARLDRVKQMLRDTAAPVSTVASACGFHHPEVLTRSFRRAFGLSPSDYRRQHLLRD
jgi:LacI family transcriptional regulator